MHYCMIYAYSLLHNSFMFRGYYLGIFKELKLKYFKTHTKKLDHHEHAYIVVSIMQNYTGFG